MIFEQKIGNIQDLDNLDDYQIETIEIPYEYLNKDILRVTSDKGNDYGISIDHKKNPLTHGDILQKNNNELLVVAVKPQQMIIITPSDIDEMGILAHLLGNTHKPITVNNGQIVLEVDPVIEKLLLDRNIEFEIQEIVLEEPLNYVNLSHEHHE